MFQGAIEEPPSLVDLRARTTAMLPRVELPEVILEVMSWAPELAEAFTAVSVSVILAQLVGFDASLGGFGWLRNQRRASVLLCRV